MKKNNFYDLFDKVQNFTTPLQAHSFFEAAKEMYGLEHVLYAKVNGSTQKQEDITIQGTYSNEWLQHYLASGYFDIDPVTQSGLVETLPFDWRDLPKDSKAVNQLFNEAGEFGIGNQGLSIPLFDAQGERALFNINTSASDRDWDKCKGPLLRDFHIISHFFHHRLMAEVANMPPLTDHDLSTVEIECLKWAAEGKSIWETSVILTLPERNVRYHLDQARRKLQCNTKIQAVAKAVAVGLINIS